MAITRTYSEHSARELAGKRRARLGGPRPTGPAAAQEAWFERFTTAPGFGSHMPLDTEAHWSWRNPLNIIPAMMMLLTVIALVAAIV